MSSDLVTAAERAWGEVDSVRVFGRDVRFRDAINVGAVLVLVALVAWIMDVFFRTKLGTAMRATGDNPQMIRATWR